VNYQNIRDDNKSLLVVYMNRNKFVVNSIVEYENHFISKKKKKKKEKKKEIGKERNSLEVMRCIYENENVS